MEKLLEEDHSEALNILEELPTTYRDQGFLEGAEELRERVANEKLWGKEYTETHQQHQLESIKALLIEVWGEGGPCVQLLATGIMNLVLRSNCILCRLPCQI